jgi:hypothetical protein
LILVRQAAGTGTRNLYSLEDLYLMGVAREFSDAGFTPKAIGVLLAALRPELAHLRRSDSVTVWRKPSGAFHLWTQPKAVRLSHTLALRSLLDSIDEAVAAFGAKRP